MTPEINMPGPLCLIENINEQLTVNQEALKILSTINQPLVVVAIVGLYRTGKSYLMNKLAGKENGFSIGSTVQANTKGIWMWCVPHPKKPNHTLVLLDTEGLGDTEKVRKEDLALISLLISYSFPPADQTNDIQIFSLAVRLSSVLVYNTMNKIDQDAINQLHIVTELTNLLRARSPPDLDEVDDAVDCDNAFPHLVWTVRDFFLDLRVNGQAITADEYLENSLTTKQGIGERVQKFNLSRLCIQKCFPNKKCFVFELPSQKKNLPHLETLDNNELDPDFVQQVAEFCSYIYNCSKVKTLSGNIKVDGPRLESLVLTYINAINKGGLPSMENTVLALAQIENSVAMQKAITHYDQQMSQKLELPTETLQELLDLHMSSEKEAIKLFKKNSFKDVDQKFQKELETQLEEKQKDFCQRNKQASLDRCTTLLQDIFRPLEEEVRQGIYSKPGGHSLYIQRQGRLKNDYYQKPKKGIEAETTLQKYLLSKEAESATILQTDLNLTAKEKEKEVARARAEAAWAEKQRLMAIQRQNQLMMEERRRRHEEQVRQMERNRAIMLAEQQRAQERILWNQARELNEMFQAEQRRLQNEIRHLQRFNDPPDDTCVLL
ncbi:LOW QUALITY PROTEIN: guanylate-binding protein 1-like [Rhynchocyon petersi]